MATRRLGPDVATIDVFTRKEGLFSAAGHDLQFRVGAFAIEIDETGQVVARIEADSLHVLHALQGDAPDPGALSPGDREKIEEAARDAVLAFTKFPTIEFRSERTIRTPSGLQVEGRLTLHGTTQPLSFDARRENGHLVADVSIDQRMYGIKPFSAVMGTLRVKPIVRIMMRVPEPG